MYWDFEVGLYPYSDPPPIFWFPCRPKNTHMRATQRRSPSRQEGGTSGISSKLRKVLYFLDTRVSADSLSSCGGVSMTSRNNRTPKGFGRCNHLPPCQPTDFT